MKRSCAPTRPLRRFGEQPPYPVCKLNRVVWWASGGGRAGGGVIQETVPLILKTRLSVSTAVAAFSIAWTFAPPTHPPTHPPTIAGRIVRATSTSALK